MLDHVFTDAIDALRVAMEEARLERQALEERFQADVLLGDITWETTYGLPGEGTPPRARADVRLDWTTWSQTAYRDWILGTEIDEPPKIDVEVTYRVQSLESPPDPRRLLAAMPAVSPILGTEELDRSGPTGETSYTDGLDAVSHAVEVTYEGSYPLDEEALGDGSTLDKHFSAMGGWIASTLVALGDIVLD
jgi:hypothetical protein